MRYEGETGHPRAVEAGPRGLNLKDAGVVYGYDFPPVNVHMREVT